MALKAIYKNKDEIPEQYQDLYSERDGQWELTGIEGARTQADVDRVKDALRKEKEDHEALQKKFKGYGDDTPDTIEELRQENEKLKIQVDAGKGAEIDEDKLEQLAERRAKTLLAPVERENAKLKKENEELSGSNQELQGTITRTAIQSEARKAAASAKCVDSAWDDIVMHAERICEVVDGKVVTKDGVGVTPGLGLEAWLSEQSEARGHWWPATVGGNSKGSTGSNAGGGNNPWHRDNWNLTQQGQYVREHGLDKAKQMASAAGSKVGAVRPTPAEGAN